jgi:hypothetical protein
MRFASRFVLWLLTGVTALAADAATKAVHHPFVAYNYSHTPAPVFVVVALFLCLVAIWQSNLVAIGAGLMFGGLCGNAGQLLLFGYATDWIPVGGWLTNLADLSGALGLVTCCAGYALSAVSSRQPARRV